MTAKRPFLLVMLVLVLVATALILPATASGAKPAEPGDNKPVNWVTYSSNSSNNVRDKDPSTWDWQGGTSALVKQLADESIVGHATLQTMKDSAEPDPRFRVSTTELFDVWFDDDGYVEPFSGRLCEGNVAGFKAVFRWEDVDFLGRFVLVDGGEGSEGADYHFLYLWGPDWGEPEGWVPFYDPFVEDLSVPTGNVQVHLGNLGS